VAWPSYAHVLDVDVDIGGRVNHGYPSPRTRPRRTADGRRRGARRADPGAARQSELVAGERASGHRVDPPGRRECRRGRHGQGDRRADRHQRADVRRLRLRSLAAGLRAAFEDGRITAGVAERAARLPDEQQARLEQQLDQGERLTLADVRYVTRDETSVATAALPTELFTDHHVPWQATVPGLCLRYLRSVAPTVIEEPLMVLPSMSRHRFGRASHRSSLSCLDRRRERASASCPVQGPKQTSPSRRW